IRKSAKAGVRTGKTSIRSSVIRRISARPSTIYTTNAVESLNSVIRATIKKRKVFPTDDSVRKVIYLAIKDASKKWSMPIQNWRLAMGRFIIEFGDRLSNHL
ncbi:transposase, partial [Salmonella enterica subsp. enterica serovar Derby]|nr:transposase [Salmonella enterica subsp. enterica serovar Derby]